MPTRDPIRRTTAALVAGVAALSLLAGCGDDPDPDPTASDTRSRSPQPDPSTAGETSPAGEPTSSAPPARVTVPVYFVGDTPQGPRLFREFRTVPGDDPLTAAAALLTTGDAADPDYRTLFPNGTFTSVYEEGEWLVARVSDDAWEARPAGMTRAEARLAVQSLVYTLQGVAQDRKRVLVGIDVSDWVPLFGEFSSPGFREAPPLDVLGLVSVTSPEQGATVSGSFTASGVASSFEATVPWEIRDGGGEAVKKGFATAEGWMDKLYPWEAEVDVSDLPPGDYTFVAMTSDPSSGEGGGPTEDSKDITIE